MKVDSNQVSRNYFAVEKKHLMMMMIMMMMV